MDGPCTADWNLTYRVRDGVGRSSLRGFLGNAVRTFEGAASLSGVRPKIDR